VLKIIIRKQLEDNMEEVSIIPLRENSAEAIG